MEVWGLGRDNNNIFIFYFNIKVYPAHDRHQTKETHIKLLKLIIFFGFFVGAMKAHNILLLFFSSIQCL